MAASDGAIDLAGVQAVCLDVGGTLVGIDYSLVVDELVRLGVRTTPEALWRAEAAARPRVSARLAALGPDGAVRGFEVFLGEVLARLLPAERGERVERLAAAVAPLRVPGRADRLWSRVLPGTRAALTQLAELGLRLAVVSNADGTVERGLVDQGLRAFFDVVVDSHVVGCEKPDPRIFEVALTRLGVPAARALHVGDMHYADVVGARAAGLSAVLLDPFDDWGETDCPRLPDVLALAAALARARA